MDGALVAVVCAFCLILTVIVLLSVRTLIGEVEYPLSQSEREAADARGQELLNDLLEEHEYGQLMECGYVDVASPNHQDRTYRIPLTEGLVQVYERGELTKRLCLQSTEYLPRSDLVILHKLMITGNEQEYLARANTFPPLFHAW